MNAESSLLTLCDRDFETATPAGFAHNLTIDIRLAYLGRMGAAFKCIRLFPGVPLKRTLVGWGAFLRE